MLNSSRTIRRVTAVALLASFGVGALGCVISLKPKRMTRHAMPLVVPLLPEKVEPRTVPEDITATATRYRRLTPMIEDPAIISPELAMLCRGATESAVEDERLEHGPHTHAFVMIYMNEIAASSFREQRTPYPVGSIIVKEKDTTWYLRDGSVEGVVDPPNAVGGMIKRDPGFDPEHGDWEYFYFDHETPIQHGRITSCVQCHDVARETDRVFGAWYTWEDL